MKVWLSSPMILQRLLASVVLLAAGNMNAYCSEPTVEVAWMQYSLCVAALIEDAAVRDLGQAQINLRNGRKSVPVDFDELERSAKNGCFKYRKQLNDVYFATEPRQRGKVPAVLEIGLFSILRGEVSAAQKKWVADGKFSKQSK